MKLTNKWLFGLGSALVAGAAAAILVFQQKKSAGYEKPPKGAPQLDIDNPGSQDNFPTAASESEIG